MQNNLSLYVPDEKQPTVTTGGWGWGGMLFLLTCLMQSNLFLRAYAKF